MNRRTLLCGVAVGLSGCVEAASAPRPDTERAETLTRAGINNLRREAGVSELASSDDLATTARAHSRDMYERDFYAHENPDGEGPNDRVACGASETIHRGIIGYVETQDGERWNCRETEPLAAYLVRGWRLSTPHRKAILEPNHKRAGVGIYAGADEFFATALFC